MSELLAAVANARMGVRAALCASLLAWLITLGGCSDKPTGKDCEKLLERFIDLEAAAAGTNHISPAMREDLDKQRKALRDYMSESFVEECRENMSVAVVKCGLEAKTLADYAGCEP